LPFAVTAVTSSLNGIPKSGRSPAGHRLGAQV